MLKDKLDKPINEVKSELDVMFKELLGNESPEEYVARIEKEKTKNFYPITPEITSLDIKSTDLDDDPRNRVKMPEPRYAGKEIEISVFKMSYKYKVHPGGEETMICRVSPWSTVPGSCPLTLELAIMQDGTIIHRGWHWSGEANSYLHTYIGPWEEEHSIATEAMARTLAKIFTGAITFDGIKISIGATPQRRSGLTHEILVEEYNRLGQPEPAWNR